MRLVIRVEEEKMEKADLRVITPKLSPATISKPVINLRGRRNVTIVTLLNKYKTSNRNLIN